MSEKKHEAAKVLVVTEAGGRERRYTASAFGYLDKGALAIGDPYDDRAMKAVAIYAPGEWKSAHEDGVIEPDRTARKLAIALVKLKAIASVGTLEDAHETADEALADIADVDL